MMPKMTKNIFSRRVRSLWYGLVYDSLKNKIHDTVIFLTESFGFNRRKKKKMYKRKKEKKNETGKLIFFLKKITKTIIDWSLFNLIFPICHHENRGEFIHKKLISVSLLFQCQVNRIKIFYFSTFLLCTFLTRQKYIKEQFIKT